MENQHPNTRATSTASKSSTTTNKTKSSPPSLPKRPKRTGKGKKKFHNNHKGGNNSTRVAKYKASCNGVRFTIHTVLQYPSKTSVLHRDQDLPPPPPHKDERVSRIVYTSGLHEAGMSYGGFPELVAFNVPACKTKQVRGLFAFLAYRMQEGNFVAGGEVVDSDDLIMNTKWLLDPDIRFRLGDRFAIPGMAGGNLMDGTQNKLLPRKWLSLQPHFHHVTDTLWASRPVAPYQQTALRDRIIETFWENCHQICNRVPPAPGTTFPHSAPLVRYVDGNPLNCSLANLQPVALYEVFQHPYWYTNWAQFLLGDAEMIQYTQEHRDHFALIFKPLLSDKRPFSLPYDFDVDDEAKIRCLVDASFAPVDDNKPLVELPTTPSTTASTCASPPEPSSPTSLLASPTLPTVTPTQILKRPEVPLPLTPTEAEDKDDSSASPKNDTAPGRSKHHKARRSNKGRSNHQE